MRKGQNPVKQLTTIAKPERITVAVLNHIPFLEGFYAEMDKVLELSLNSLHNSAGLPFDLLVFDNNSCLEIRMLLEHEFEAGRIQNLILSDKNLGKGGAWNIMLQAAPGEVVAYADNDVLYSPGWLSEAVKILDTFPRVGMVTSRPFHTLPDLYKSVVSWAGKTRGAKLQRGQFLDPNWNREFLLSIGRTEEEIQLDLKQEDIRVTFHGVTAYAGASHWQFIGWKKVLQEFLPMDLSKPLGQVLRLDQEMDKKGYLRLMTARPFTMNLSNTLELPDKKSSLESLKIKPKKPKPFFDIPFVRKVLMKIYNEIFRIYYKSANRR
jgi:glycosyltransferase involved in cell wall biosynthesis